MNCDSIWLGIPDRDKMTVLEIILTIATDTPAGDPVGEAWRRWLLERKENHQWA